MALRALQGPTGGGAPVGGGGTSSPSTIPRWTGPSTLGDSGLIDDGSTITSSRPFAVERAGGTVANTEYLKLRNTTSGANSNVAMSFYVSNNSVRTAAITHLATSLTNYDTVFSNWNGSALAEVMRLQQGGNVGIGTASPASRLDVAGTITCDDAGTGLKLPATPGNTDPNTLDAYEDGGTAGTGGKTWTPTDTSGAGLTLTVTKAQYIRVGKQITFAFELTYPVTADPTNAAISVPVTGITNWAASGVVYINTLGLRMWMISGGSLYFYTTAGVRMTNAQLSGLAVYGGSSYIAA